MKLLDIFNAELKDIANQLIYGSTDNMFIRGNLNRSPALFDYEFEVFIDINKHVVYVDANSTIFL